MMIKDHCDYLGGLIITIIMAIFILLFIFMMMMMMMMTMMLRPWTRGFSGSQSRAREKLSLAWQDNVFVR